MKITPVILSGGSGTRLWPVSRELNPKQFLNLFGEHSLFQQTALRVKNQSCFNKPIIICNNEHRFIIAEELQKIKVEPNSIILEPVGRNTAPAIAIAAIDVVTNNPKDDIILATPSDHVITDSDGFISQVKKVAEATKDEYLITFGITPNKPETGFGYIKKSANSDSAQQDFRQVPKDFSELFAVEKFIEKPDKETAEEFVRSGKYLWNSGIFMFRASVYLEMLQKFHNEIFIHCINAYSKATRDLDFIRLQTDYFEKCPNISIDYAVMEKAEKIAVTPIDVGWSDVGSWHAIAELTKQDQNNNSLIGDVLAIKSKNCYISSQDSLVAAIGAENLIIVSLKDATLIINKNNTQDVKEIVAILKEHKREEYHSHPKVLRPWGSFEVINISDRFKIKKIIVKSGSSLSLQMHNHRAEHWVVIKGAAHVTCGSKQFILTEDESTYIPVGKKHRLENKGKIPLELIEVQTGSYLGEDDIIRLSDIYGR